jgi:hypothetical protein
MKRFTLGLVAVVLVMVVFAMATPVGAHDYDRANDGHIFRMLAYVLHPIGIGLEYGIMRPIHQGVSQPHFRIIFGHDPRNELDEHGRYPVCVECQATPPVVQCPSCKKPILKPRDEYWVWE